MACESCDPRLAPTGPRRPGAHFGVRFGASEALVSVYKDGEAITDCYEVDAPHRAWRYVKPYAVCECGSGQAAAFLDETGGFTVDTREWLAMHR